jgi:hypothetical protein
VWRRPGRAGGSGSLLDCYIMGAFIGYGDVGVWANNRERDTFLDWFALHRCTVDDARWAYCKSDAQRYSGRCIDLEELIPCGTILEISDEEYIQAAVEHWPDFARLLGIIESITRGDWQLRDDMKASNSWRRDYLKQLEQSRRTSASN